MTKEELKPQAEDMLYQLISLVHYLPNDQQHELLTELACTIITSNIKFDFDNKKATLNDLNDVIHDEIIPMCFKGAMDVLSGERDYKVIK